jgi:hypothetical protein
MGGLGNQMFQYAAARGVANAGGAAVQLDLEWFDVYGDQRRYELDQFRVVASELSEERRRRWRALRRAGTLLARVHPALGRVGGFYRERRFTFDPAVRSLRGDVYLDGYWQSPRYFEPVAREVRQELQPRRALSDSANRLRQLALSEGAVSVHVRRGDYVSNGRAARQHGLCPIDYYVASCSWISSRIVKPKFLVFSDDPAWAEANLRLPGDVVQVSRELEGEAVEELAVMSACRHAVLANSTFSWWGAWLGDARSELERIVIAPKSWFSNPAMSADDLLPARWTRL